MTAQSTDFYKLGILGSPLGHTLSPVLHAFLLERLQLQGFYHPHVVSPENPATLPETIQVLQQEGYRGVNITLPHKVSAMASVDTLTPAAQRVGALNTLVFEADGTRTGHNTDVSGFLRSLPLGVQETLSSRKALVLGAGGSARAIVAGLLQAPVIGLTLAARNLEKAHALLSAMECPDETVAAGTLWGEIEDLFAYDLIVNTTPIGMAPHSEDCPLTLKQLGTLPRRACVVDLIYRPQNTRLVEDAQKQGVNAINGLAMLVYQGVEAFELWTQRTVDRKTVLDALDYLSKQV